MADLPNWHSYDYAGREYTLSVKDHQKEVRKWCIAMYDEAKRELEGNDEIRSLTKYVEYVMGKQWNARRPAYRAAPVDNRLWTNLVQEVSYLTDTRQTFEVRAENKNYEQTAIVLNKRNSAWAIARNLDLVTSQVAMYSAISGIGYVRQVWNPELDGGEGDISFEPCGPTEVIPIKPGSDIQAAYGLIYEKWMPLPWFRRNYPTLGQLVGPDETYTGRSGAPNVSSPATMAGQPLHNMNPFQRYLQGANAEPRTEAAIQMGKYQEYWVRDFSVNTSNVEVYVGSMLRGTGYTVKPGQRLYPRGRLIIKGGDVILYDGPNPHWHGRFPFAAMRLNQVPWQWIGVSELRNQIPLQDIINNILAGILDMCKKAVNPPIQAPINAFSDSMRKSMDPNMPGMKAYYNLAAGNNPLQYGPVPQLPNYVYETLLWAKGELADQTGFIDQGTIASKGLLPGADTMELLTQSQQTLVRLKVRNMETFFREVGEQWIANAFQFYRTPRTILASGLKGLTWTDFEWNPQELSPEPLDPAAHWRSFKWTVMPGTMLKSQAEAEKATAIQLRRMGDIDRKTLYKVLDMEPMFDAVEQGLKREGADMLVNMIKQKMSGVDGGGAMHPSVLKEINNATMEKPVAL